MRSPLNYVVGIGILLAGLAGTSCRQPPADTVSALQGVWTVVEIQQTDAEGRTETFQAQPGQFIFTRSHYSAVYVPSPGVRKPFATRWQPTSDEMVAAYESVIVNSGAYQVSGSRVTVRPVIAKTPEFVGGYQTYEYKIDGDLLTLESIELESRDGVRLLINETLRLRRSE